VGFNLCFPKKCIFGIGTFAQLGKEAKEFGRRAVLVTGRGSTKRAGIVDRAIELLSSEGIEPILFDGVEGEPSTDVVDMACDLIRERGCDLVIGVGGGSPIDVAKAAAAVAAHDGRTSDFLLGRKAIVKEGYPFIAVPTTAGTGAEVTRNSVLIEKGMRVKRSLRDPRMMAKVAIVDPELTVSMPPSVTASSGMDALTHAIEAYVSKASNPISDALAIRAIPLISSYLPRAYEDGSDLHAREMVMLGSFMTGLAFANASLGAVHGLAHPIGAQFGVPHGIACAILLPHVMRYNIPAVPGKYADIARAMGVDEDIDDLSLAHKAVDKVFELLDLLGIHRSFSAYGIEEEDIPGIIRDATGTSMESNPRPTTPDELYGILKDAILR
jgi:alcohol dehydrogenase class IV